MMTIHSLDVDGIIFTGFHLELPAAHLFIITNDIGFIVSTTMGMDFIKTADVQQTVIAGMVREIDGVDELLQAPLMDMTACAKRCGWSIGMTGKEALLRIS